MFNEKRWLRSLQQIQNKIEDLKQNIRDCGAPKCDLSRCDVKYMLDRLLLIMTGRKDPLMLFIECGNQYEYLRNFGTYLVGLADANAIKEKYEQELQDLQIEERKLKDKLGIK